MKQKTVSFLTLAIILLGVLAAIPIRHVAALDQKLMVVPDSVIKWSDVDNPGDTFEVSIIAANITNLFGYDFTLTWTPGVINCTLEEINFNLWGPGNFLGPWISPSIDNVAGSYRQSLTGRAPGVPPPFGDYWLINLTFTIVAPAPFGSYVDTNLDLQKSPGYISYALLDPGSNEIAHDFVDGYYRYNWRPPTEFPYLEVNPAMNIFAGKNIYKTPFSFSVDINVKNVDPGWKMAGIEFYLMYNTTVLDVLSVTQGNFFAPFCVAEFFTAPVYEGLGKIHVGYAMLGYLADPFGEGLVCTIEFNATLQEQFPQAVWSDLDLQVAYGNGMTSFFIDYLTNDITYQTETDGYYELAGYVIGRVIDVYTQYPDPYGGQGPMQPSDMFWPQKEVILCVNVTYNEWPVQNKLVAFEIRDPSGALVDMLTAVTDDYGMACTSYRIPWPCDNPEDLFGVWEVTATVDIACIVVNDTLWFHFDYLVSWIDVTTDKAEYAHCEDIKVTIAFGSHAMQSYTILIGFSVHDELNYPFGATYVEFQIGGAVFCELEPYELELQTHVVKWVAAGTATIYVNAYSDWPSMGGSPLAPTYTPAPEVNILAAWA
jgi:hypothetical protein